MSPAIRRIRASGSAGGQFCKRFYRACEVAVVAIVWQFDVRPGREKEFEDLYGADGAWTQLSRRSREYLGSSFLRDIALDRRYLLVEYWGEMVIYEKHLADFSREVEALERQRALLVERAEPAGVFTALDVPQRVGPTWSRRSGKRPSAPPGVEP